MTLVLSMSHFRLLCIMSTEKPSKGDSNLPVSFPSVTHCSSAFEMELWDGCVLNPSHDAPRSLFSRALLAPMDETDNLPCQLAKEGIGFLYTNQHFQIDLNKVARMKSAYTFS